MRKIMSKWIAGLLTAALLLAIVLVPAPVDAAPSGIQDGVTLHCWNWSFQNIEANMARIAQAGYTAIQTSPIQRAKQNTAGSQTYDWWVYYQPASFSIDNTGRSALGNKAEFKSMCATAHRYGIKVIVDVVANHMGDNGSNKISPAVISDLRNDPSCWHDISKNVYDYSRRYDITQWCMIGLPDLNTGSSKVQNYVLNFLKECIDAGADGFRFDAAKHIETPDDGRDNCASNFWPTVINGAKNHAKSTRGIELYCYGEMLDSPGGNLGVDSYTKYMSITDNTWSNHVRNQVVGSGNAGSYSYAYHKNTTADKLVLWAESHDNYTGDGSHHLSTQQINKAWALVAARADAMSLYLARPSGYTQPLGTASSTGWANTEVAAVNKFHTAFAGQSEYVSNEGSIAYVERGSSGAVLVNCSGSGCQVNVSAHAMKDGTYTDQITGNRFTVSGGRIRGNIGSTGIAVVYEAAANSTPIPQQTIYFKNSAGWSRVNVYSWYEGGVEITASWPGDAMTKVEGALYSCTLPEDAVNVIFNNGSTQTSDLQIPAGKDLYDFSTGKWSVYEPAQPECVHSSHNTGGNCTECGEYVGHRFGSTGICACGKVHPNVPTKPTEPTTEPTVPVTEPVTEPTVPVTKPTVPSTDPTVPVTEPTTPPTEATEPTTVPTEPVTVPTEPETTAPVTEPTASETEPGTPETEPTNPETEPATSTTEPATEPAQPVPSTDPTEPSGSGNEKQSSLLWLIPVVLVLAGGGAALFLIRKRKGTAA